MPGRLERVASGGAVRRPLSRFAGPALFAGLLVLDQVTKAIALAMLAGRGRGPVTPFFNLTLVWNPGVSFGFLQAGGELGRWLLVGLTLIIAGALVYWLRQEARPLPRFAIWLILAGALGNVIDRLRFGAVIDFLDFHAFGYHWPAFNVADSAIVVGACLLVADSLLGGRSALSRKGGTGL